VVPNELCGGMSARVELCNHEAPVELCNDTLGVTDFTEWNDEGRESIEEIEHEALEVWEDKVEALEFWENESGAEVGALRAATRETGISGGKDGAAIVTPPVLPLGARMPPCASGIKVLRGLMCEPETTASAPVPGITLVGAVVMCEPETTASAPVPGITLVGAVVMCEPETSASAPVPGITLVGAIRSSTSGAGDLFPGPRRRFFVRLLDSSVSSLFEDSLVAAFSSRTRLHAGYVY
jgi:hypothetical protein